MVRAVFLAGLFTLAMTLAACSARDQHPAPGIACTTQAVSSVVAHVSTASGVPITGADVRYSVNNSAFAPTESAINGIYGMAYETTGNFVVRVVVDTQPMQEQSTTVIMDSVGCHVVTQELFFIFQ